MIISSCLNILKFYILFHVILAKQRSIFNHFILCNFYFVSVSNCDFVYLLLLIFMSNKYNQSYIFLKN